jgi:hypothetical protein
VRDFRYKVTIVRNPPEQHNWDISVWAQEITDPAEPGPWHMVVAKRRWVDPQVYNGGPALKLLLGSLR